MKKLSVLFAAALFAGCGTLVQQTNAFDVEGYTHMIEGKFSSLEDVVSLVPKTIEEVKRCSSFAVKRAQEKINDLIATPSAQRTFDNTPRALDELSREFSLICSSLQLLELVSPDEKLQDAAKAAVLEMKKFSVDAFMNRDIYRSFKEYRDGAKKSETLTKEQEYFFRESMKDFKRSGFELPDEQFEQVKALKKEFSEVGQEFSHAIAQDESAVFVDSSALEGVSEGVIKNLPRDEHGKVRLGCDYPTYFEVMGHCKNEDTRHKLYLAFNNRAYPDNIDRLHTMIALRDRIANKLGYASYAHLDTEAHMVKTPERAEQFLLDLIAKVEKKEAQEMALLKSDLPQGVSLTDSGLFKPWDTSFISKSYKKKHFNVDDRKVAEYFAMDQTVQGIFDIYQKFLGVKFEYVKPKDVWHKDVKCIKVLDPQKDDEVMGYIFLDLHPRKGKYSHACCAPLSCPQFRKQADGSIIRMPGVNTVVANFPKPSGEKPSLLKHSDVETFFHEFGHAMHCVLGATDLADHSGFNVKWDFVEMPSQMFEEWMWDRDMLKQVSSHYETGEPLPDELINNMIKLKKFDSGSFVKRQAMLSLLSLECYKAGEKKDTQEIRKRIHDTYHAQYVQFEPEGHMQSSFGHLKGYGAKYYGYLWSKVFALDLFETVKKHGLLDSTIGKKMVADVLGRGGSAEPDELLFAFLGREPSQEAFFKDLGL